MFNQNNQDCGADGRSHGNRSRVGSGSPVVVKVNSKLQPLQSPWEKSALSGGKSCMKRLVGSIHNEFSLPGHHDEDDSMFILLPPSSLAKEINTQDLLVSPSKTRGKLVCDWNAINSTESAELNSGLESNACLGSSSALLDSVKDNVTVSLEELCDGEARFTTFSHTPPRASIRLSRRRCQLDWSHGTPSGMLRCLHEDSVLTANIPQDISSICAMTPNEDEEAGIRSPPPLHRLQDYRTPASLSRPLPLKVQLPSL